MSTYLHSSHTHEVSSDVGTEHNTIHVCVNEDAVSLHTDDTHLIRMSWRLWKELVATVEASHKELKG